VKAPRADFERKRDRLGRARLPDRRLDRRHFSSRLKWKRGWVDTPPQIVRLHRQPLAQCLHGVPPYEATDRLKLAVKQLKGYPGKAAFSAGV
jgi:hypothetical protein